MNFKRTLTILSVLLISKTTFAATTIKIGLLANQSGYGILSGQQIEKSLRLGLDEANRKNMRSKDGLRYELVVFNTQGDPDLALDKLQMLHEQGVSIVFGPPSEEELSEVAGYAEKNKMLLLNVSSLPTGMLKSKKSIMQFLPDASGVSSSIASVMSKDGVSSAVLIHLDSVQMTAQAKSYGTALSRQKIKIQEMLHYEDKPESIQALVSNLIKQTSSSQSGKGSDKIGFVFIGHNREEDILSLAKNYPLLHRVKWYASDIAMKFSEVTEDSSLANFAADTHFKNAFLNVDLGEMNRRRVHGLLRSTLRLEPDPRSVVAYTVFRAVDAALSETGSYDQSKLKLALADIQSQGAASSKKISIGSSETANTISQINYWQVVRKNNRVVWDRVR